MSGFYDEDCDYGYECATDDNSVDYEEEDDVDEFGSEDEIIEENEVLFQDEYVVEEGENEFEDEEDEDEVEEEGVDEVGDSEDDIIEENEVLFQDEYVDEEEKTEFEDEDEEDEDEVEEEQEEDVDKVEEEDEDYGEDKYEDEDEENKVKVEEDEGADEDEDEEDEDYLPFYHPHARPSGSKRMKRKQWSRTQMKSRKRKDKSSGKTSSGAGPSKKRKVESTSKVPQNSQQSSMQSKKFLRKNKKSSKKSKKKKPHVKISANAIRKFSAAKAGYVKIPKDKMKWARKMATLHTEGIRLHCKENYDAREIFSHFEFTGSFYEHLKTKDADELDILVVLDTKNNAYLEDLEVKGFPGYARIRATTEKSKYWKPEFIKKKGRNGYVDPVKVRNWFFGHVQKYINEYDKSKQEKDPELKVEDNGPARTLVIHDKENDCKLKMDLVPAFLFKPKKGLSPKAPAIKGKRRYLPKPLPEDDNPKIELLWRRSFSLEEKKKMEKMDKKDKGCRREVIRVVKAIRERDKPLLKLKSYHIKTAFLHYNFGKGQEALNWSSKHLPERFLGLLDYLRKRISEKKIAHFFISELNLLKEPEFSHSALDNIENRLSKLISNDKELKKALMQQPGRKKRKR